MRLSCVELNESIPTESPLRHKYGLSARQTEYAHRIAIRCDETANSYIANLSAALLHFPACQAAFLRALFVLIEPHWEVPHYARK
jgi:hypothetical protein